MGLLDRFTSLFGRSEGGDADPKGPLGLLPGDVVTHYRERFQVTAVRVLRTESGPLYHYRMCSADGDVQVLVARDAGVDGWSLQQVMQDQRPDWSAETIPGPGGETFRLRRTGRHAVRAYGNTGYADPRQVAFREYVDEEEESVLVLEDYGSGREVRIGHAVYEGELQFEGGAGHTDERPWAEAGQEAEGDAAAEVQDEAAVVRGSAVAAALALEGRFVTDLQPSESFSDTDPFEYADDEWADARDSLPQAQALPGSIDAPHEPRAEWLTPTRWVAGSGEIHVPDDEDDWLVRTPQAAAD